MGNIKTQQGINTQICTDIQIIRKKTRNPTEKKTKDMDRQFTEERITMIDVHEVHEELFKFSSCQRPQMKIRHHFRFIRLASHQKAEYQVLKDSPNPHWECVNSYSHSGEPPGYFVKSRVHVPYGLEVLLQEFSHSPQGDSVKISTAMMYVT